MRKTYSSEFKFKIALEALKERKTLQEIASENQISASQVSRWAEELRKNGKTAFEKNSKDLKKIKLLEEEQTRLYSIVGELTMEIDWLKKKLEKLGEL